MQATNPTDFSLTKVVIYPNGGKPERAITPLIVSFEYVENITQPFLSAKMQVVDSAGLLTGLPIQGGERVVVEVDAKAFKKKVSYEFVIWTIQNRFVRQQKQSYDIGLVSAEALINEVTRVNKPLSGNPEGIVKDLLTNILKVSKTV